MVSYHSAKFGSPKNCKDGDMMILVVEGQDSTCPRLNPLLLFISKAHESALHFTLSSRMLVTRFQGNE